MFKSIKIGIIALAASLAGLLPVQADRLKLAAAGGSVDDLVLLALNLLLPLPLKGLDALVRLRARDQGLLQLFEWAGLHGHHGAGRNVWRGSVTRRALLVITLREL